MTLQDKVTGTNGWIDDDFEFPPTHTVDPPFPTESQSSCLCYCEHQEIIKTSFCDKTTIRYMWNVINMTLFAINNGGERENWGIFLAVILCRATSNYGENSSTNDLKTMWRIVYFAVWLCSPPLFVPQAMHAILRGTAGGSLLESNCILCRKWAREREIERELSSMRKQ